MKLTLGEKIKSLRRHCARTQDDLATALGVTAQAVSRWEAGGSYPDMELIPSIANYFGISIDELFGYQNDRDRKIDAILQKIDSFHIGSRGDDDWVDECLEILREGLAEFPQNERLLLALASTLSEAGWRRHKEWVNYDEEGYIRHDYDTHRKNPYWAEAIRIFETLSNTACDRSIANEAISSLVLLYRNVGENAKAVACAERMPRLKDSREVLLAGAEDGKEEARYTGELLLEMARHFADQVVYALITDLKHYQSDLPIEKVKGVLALYAMLCDDGNYGVHHGKLIQLYLYLSRLEWERGYHDDAFRSLDQALLHAKALEAVYDGREHSYTAPLVSHVSFKTEPVESGSIAQTLPVDWPFWGNPHYDDVEKEIKADPRWAEWVERCNGK